MAAEIVPVLVLGPIAGVAIDRFSRKSVMIGADLFRALLALSLLWPQGAWHAYVVAAGMAAGNTFFNPTVQAVIPVLTTEQQRLAANSVVWSTGRLVQILESAVVGGLIALVGTGPAFALNAATFVFSAAMIASLRIPALAGQLGGASKRGLTSYFADAQAGLAYAVHDRFVSRLLLVQGLASLATGATGAMLVVLSRRHLGLPPRSRSRTLSCKASRWPRALFDQRTSRVVAQPQPRVPPDVPVIAVAALEAFIARCVRPG